uniref:TPM_phosphatase domain-containing protein n=1 Tax=Rhabditophanes sp. KR3021 TaxID=114890 RepID=A0AC35TWA4_9BILA
MKTLILSLLTIANIYGQNDEVYNKRYNYPDFTPETYPNSLQDLEACHITLPSFVCDANGWLDEHENQRGTEYLQSLIERVRRTTYCACNGPTNYFGGCDPTSLGYTISIAVLSKLRRNYNFTSVEEKLNQMSIFTQTLRQRQRRGKCDDDILIALSVQDGAVWTSIGKTANHHISTENINEITKIADTYFKDMKYTEGLALIVRSFGTLLKGDELDLSKHTDWYYPLPLWLVVVIGCIIIVMILAVIASVVYYIIQKRQEGRRDSYSLGIRDPSFRPVKAKNIIRKETQKNERGV